MNEAGSSLIVYLAFLILLPRILCSGPIGEVLVCASLCVGVGVGGIRKAIA